MNKTILTYTLCGIWLGTSFITSGMEPNSPSAQFEKTDFSATIIPVDASLESTKEHVSNRLFRDLFNEYDQHNLPFVLARKVHILANHHRFYDHYDLNNLDIYEPTTSSDNIYFEYFLRQPLDKTWLYLGNSLDAYNGNQTKLTLLSFTRMAKRSYDKEVDKEIASAFLMLGLCFEYGSGVSKNYPLAFYFYSLAAKGGIKEADLSLSYLLNENNTNFYIEDRDAARRLIKAYIKNYRAPLNLSARSQTYIEILEKLCEALPISTDMSFDSTNKMLEEYHNKAKQKRLYKAICNYHHQQVLKELSNNTTVEKFLDFSIGLLTSNNGELFLDSDTLGKVNQILTLVQNTYGNHLTQQQREKINFINNLIKYSQFPSC